LKKLNLFILILIFFVVNGNAKVIILDKLEDPGKTLQNQKWSFFTDRVMGGLSEGKVELDNIFSLPCYRMTGNVTTENNGGFIQMRVLTKPNISIKNHEGIFIKVYGNSKKYKLHIKTENTIAPWQHYSFSFFAENDWLEIKAPFSQFKKSNMYQPKKLLNQKINSIGLVAGYDNFKADICLAEIGIY
tara:strand:+ start:705 stop:1268 length:564 start_codon:yes stop_codon:yes gene_type:complete